MRLSRADFYAMRPGEFWEAWHAYNEDKLADRRHSGELARGIALRLFNIQLPRKDQIREPEKFWRMPWDTDLAAEENARIITELNNMSDEERDVKALELLNKIGWHKDGGNSKP